MNNLTMELQQQENGNSYRSSYRGVLNSQIKQQQSQNLTPIKSRRSPQKNLDQSNNRMSVNKGIIQNDGRQSYKLPISAYREYSPQIKQDFSRLSHVKTNQDMQTSYLEILKKNQEKLHYNKLDYWGLIENRQESYQWYHMFFQMCLERQVFLKKEQVTINDMIQKRDMVLQSYAQELDSLLVIRGHIDQVNKYSRFTRKKFDNVIAKLVELYGSKIDNIEDILKQSIQISSEYNLQALRNPNNTQIGKFDDISTKYLELIDESMAQIQQLIPNYQIQMALNINSDEFASLSENLIKVMGEIDITCKHLKDNNISQSCYNEFDKLESIMQTDIEMYSKEFDAYNVRCQEISKLIRFRIVNCEQISRDIQEAKFLLFNLNYPLTDNYDTNKFVIADVDNTYKTSLKQLDFYKIESRIILENQKGWFLTEFSAKQQQKLKHQIDQVFQESETLGQIVKFILTEYPKYDSQLMNYYQVSQQICQNQQDCMVELKKTQESEQKNIINQLKDLSNQSNQCIGQINRLKESIQKFFLNIPMKQFDSKTFCLKTFKLQASIISQLQSQQRQVFNELQFQKLKNIKALQEEKSNIMSSLNAYEAFILQMKEQQDLFDDFDNYDGLLNQVNRLQQKISLNSDKIFQIKKKEKNSVELNQIENNLNKAKRNLSALIFFFEEFLYFTPNNIDKFGGGLPIKGQIQPNDVEENWCMYSNIIDQLIEKMHEEIINKNDQFNPLVFEQAQQLEMFLQGVKLLMDLWINFHVDFVKQYTYLQNNKLLGDDENIEEDDESNIKKSSHTQELKDKVLNLKTQYQDKLKLCKFNTFNKFSNQFQQKFQSYLKNVTALSN